MVEGHANLSTCSPLAPPDINHSSRVERKVEKFHYRETIVSKKRQIYSTRGEVRSLRNRGQNRATVSNLGQCLRRDTPASTNRNLTNGIYTHIYTHVIRQAAAEIIAHVYACACVRVRAIPAQVHVLLTISNCTTAEGRPRKTFPSAVPCSPHWTTDLSSKQRGEKNRSNFSSSSSSSNRSVNY